MINARLSASIRASKKEQSNKTRIGRKRRDVALLFSQSVDDVYVCCCCSSWIACAFFVVGCSVNRVHDDVIKSVKFSLGFRERESSSRNTFESIRSIFWPICL